MSMIRKQIFLPPELERRLAIAARQQHKPEAQIVREALADKLTHTSPATAGEALLQLAELGKTLDLRLPADASERIDDYLYGETE